MRSSRQRCGGSARHPIPHSTSCTRFALTAAPLVYGIATLFAALSHLVGQGLRIMARNYALSGEIVPYDIAA